MRRIVLAFFCLPALWPAGCGNTLPSPPIPTSAPPKEGPHGGLAHALPDGLGYAEVVNEPPVEGRGEQISTSIVVYFLGPDAKVSTTDIKDVSFLLDRGKNNIQTVALKAEPKSGDPAGAGRFVSELGPYRVEDLRGDLTASIGGKPAKLSLAGGH